MLRCQPFLHWIWSGSTTISWWNVETDYTHNAVIKHYETRDLVNFQEEYNWTLGPKLILFFQIKSDKNKFKSRLILSWTLSRCGAKIQRHTRWGLCDNLPSGGNVPICHSSRSDTTTGPSLIFCTLNCHEKLDLFILLRLGAGTQTHDLDCQHCHHRHHLWSRTSSENSLLDTPVLAS